MKYRQRVREHIRKRFRSEYLDQLPNRKTGKVNCAIREGDIVLVGQDNRKRLDWPLARVVRLFPGRDGIVRVVKLQTACGELVRPIQRLYPLEMSSTVHKNLSETTTQPEEKDEQFPEAIRTRSGRRVKPVERLDF